MASNFVRLLFWRRIGVDVGRGKGATRRAETIRLLMALRSAAWRRGRAGASGGFDAVEAGTSAPSRGEARRRARPRASIGAAAAAIESYTLPVGAPRPAPSGYGHSVTIPHARHKAAEY
jgi:hypothetical protein